jgi:hypothetical protein
MKSLQDQVFQVTVRTNQRNPRVVQQGLNDLLSRAKEPFKIAHTETKDAPLTFYPEDDITRIRVEFSKVISKDQAEKIVDYWTKPKYIGKLDTVNWQGGTTMVLNIDFSQSGSRDWRKHNVLEELLKYLEEGSPVRQADGLRAVEGFGSNVVQSVVGYDDVSA